MNNMQLTKRVHSTIATPKTRPPTTSNRELLFVICEGLTSQKNLQVLLYRKLLSAFGFADEAEIDFEKIQYTRQVIYTAFRILRSIQDNPDNFSTLALTESESLIKELPTSPSSSSLANSDTTQVQLQYSRLHNEFQVFDTIGSGGFGYVLKVKSVPDDQFYAVKCLKSSQQSTSMTCKIMREIRLLADLDHPNVVRYHSSWFDYLLTKTRVRKKSSAYLESFSDDSVDDSENYYAKNEPSFSDRGDGSTSYLITFGPNSKTVETTEIIESSETSESEETEYQPKLAKSIDTPKLTLCIQMQLCDGTLTDYFADRLQVDYSKSKAIFKQAVKGLKYIHSRSIVHRDLKPSNIFYIGQNHERILIGDFGLSTKLMSSETTAR